MFAYQSLKTLSEWLKDLNTFFVDWAVRGLYLEGARWNSDKNFLMENEVMSLESKLPVILFKPVKSPRRHTEEISRNTHVLATTTPCELVS